jgi:ubiquinone/menaquinone biosynthesis C-methylase UbiE
MMKALRDPEGAELNHLIKACELTGKRVLEIGCGDGKFIRQYSSMPKRVVGLDPEFSDLCIAHKLKPASTDQPYYLQANGEKLPFPDNSFDIVIFASSL